MYDTCTHQSTALLVTVCTIHAHTKAQPSWLLYILQRSETLPSDYTAYLLVYWTQ